MNKKILYVGAVIIVILLALYIFLPGKNSSSTSVPEASASPVALQSSEPYASSTDPENQGVGLEKPVTTAITSTDSNQKIMNATLHTSMGDVTVAFSPELAPNAVANFIKLAKSGFYDGVKFHRVIKGFMIQGGDPLSKDDSQKAKWGTGGPGYKFNDEITPASKNDIGTLAMANSGPNTNGSQFYINAAANNFLDGGYVVFGKVTQGLDIVMAIDNVPTNSSDQPLTPVVIKSITF